METKLKKRRTVYVPDQTWHVINFIEDKTELKESEIMRRLLLFIKEEYDQIFLLRIIQNE